MGFGTLFFGYFLILNIAYYGFTDIISALIMLLALSKLAPLYRPFRLAVYADAVFSVFALFELVSQGADFLGIGFIGGLRPYLAVARYAIISIVTALILLGIREAAEEVGAKRQIGRAHV